LRNKENDTWRIYPPGFEKRTPGFASSTGLKPDKKRRPREPQRETIRSSEDKIEASYGGGGKFTTKREHDGGQNCGKQRKKGKDWGETRRGKPTFSIWNPSKERKLRGPQFGGT